MSNVLEIKNVSKKIGKKQILKDVSFDVHEGEIFGFVGPNGAGKSTLIKTMLGLYKLDSGSVKIAGFDISSDFEKAMENVGAIIENPEVYDYLSGMDNLKIYARMCDDVSFSYIDELVKETKLGGRINSKVRTYSLGMKQRLGVVQALLSKPKLLILDEPTNGLDPIGIKELRELLKKFSKSQGMAVFISSHILSEIELMCDRIAIIDNGEIIEVKDLNSGNVSNLSVFFEVNDIKKASSVLDSKNISYKVNFDNLELFISRDEVPSINKLFVDSLIDVYSINIKHKSLEDEFIEKTRGTKEQIR